jgi:hypothetical protein
VYALANMDGRGINAEVLRLLLSYGILPLFDGSSISYGTLSGAQPRLFPCVLSECDDGLA